MPKWILPTKWWLFRVAETTIIQETEPESKQEIYEYKECLQLHFMMGYDCILECVPQEWLANLGAEHFDRSLVQFVEFR